ncbi:MAG: hypothetical protein ABFC88_02450 [Thermoguttaceae bacterium]
MSRNTQFLGRLQLFSKGNAINEGLIPPGTYGIPESDKKIVKLGNSIDILPLARRLKALDLSDKEAIIANYDATSDEFKEIAAKSEEQDSMCMYGMSVMYGMYGTSFLVFERSTGRFLEFFCGTKSTRPVAGDIAVFLPLTASQIDAKKANNNGDVDVSQMKQMKTHGPQTCTLNVQIAKNNRSYCGKKNDGSVRHKPAGERACA